MSNETAQADDKEKRKHLVVFLIYALTSLDFPTRFLVLLFFFWLSIRISWLLDMFVCVRVQIC